VDRDLNTTNASFGMYSTLRNSSTGSLFGVDASVSSTTAGNGGTVVGVRGNAKADSDYRYGGIFKGEAFTTPYYVGDTYGIDAQAYRGNTAIGVFGYAYGANTNWAGFFSGNVRVTGALDDSKSTVIMDHPLDPENRYLHHSSVNSPDMMNVYNGVTILDARGEASVVLPEYFEALNNSFRYQLTAIGGPAPNLHIAEKIDGNRFTVAGGEPNMEVSWQVTGIRHDKYAEANRIQVEVDKLDAEIGLYLHPVEHGQPMEKHVNYKQRKESPDRKADRVDMNNDIK
jgi:hypothetical protein